MAAFTTQKITGTKTTITVPSWVRHLEENAGLNSEAASYNLIPLIFRATNLRCNALASAPVRILKGKSETEWPFDMPLKQLLWMTEAALLLSGTAFWLKRSNRVIVKDLQWLNPFAMQVEYDKQRGLLFKQTMQDGETFTPDKIVYFRDFAPEDDLTSGTASAAVALGDSKLMKYMTDFAGEFFRNGAMPTTIVHVPQGTPDTEIERVQNFFTRAITGVRKAFRVIALSGGKDAGVSVDTITPNMTDMALIDLYNKSVKSVAHAFQVPETLLTDAANYATAKEHRMSFYQDTIRPRAEIWIAETINRQLLREKGMELEFAFDEMDIFQEDEEQRSVSFYNYVQAGMKPSIAAQILGIELPSEFDPAYEVLDEGWQSEPESDTVITDDTRPREIQDELQKWMRFELRRIGKDDKREFRCEFTPAALVGAIQGALETAKDESAIRAIFRDAKRWEAYP